MCMPRALHEDEAHAEGEAGLAGGFAGSAASVCTKAAGRGINFLGVAHRQPPPCCHLLPGCCARALAAEAFAS